MDFMEIKDNKGMVHYINPDHISALCEVKGHCKISLMGHEYMLTQSNLENFKYHLTSYTH